MNKNVGTIDRIIRVLVGLAIIGAGVYYQSWWGATGGIALFTAIVGWCPPYAVLGISTCSTCKKEKK